MTTQKIVKKIYKNWQEYLIYWSWWATIEVDASLSDSSENPVQNKVVKWAIDAKITNPSWWSTWNVLKKTANGVEWWAESWWLPSWWTAWQILKKTSNGSEWANEKTELPSGWSTWQILKKTANWTEWANNITIDSAMSDSSENPVQNKVVKWYVDGIVWNIETLLAAI